MNRIGRSIIAVLGLVASVWSYNVAFSVNTALERTAISPYVYGVNCYNTDYGQTSGNPENWTLERQGGDRLVCYNWENNASNSGANWSNGNDMWLTSGFSSTKALIPGITMTDFRDFCIAHSMATMITVQMCGWVSADALGAVTSSPPSSRWKKIVVNKPGYPASYTLTPVLSDSFVYMDEMVNMLVSKYGKASTATGVKFYCLDNEPNIWDGTWKIIHPNAVKCTELISKTVQTAAMIKRLDPTAQTVGPSICCTWTSFADWDTVKGTFAGFPSWYLDQMKKASDSVGVRLLDVFDIHYISNSETAIVAQYKGLLSSINSYYPGTKLGQTEWTWGNGGATVADAMAVAFELGASGKYGLYLQTWWAMGESDYLSSGFQIFRNYDGNKSTYGDTSVQITPDSTNTHSFASVDSLKRLHIIIINKKADSLNATFTIASNIQYTGGSVYQVTSASTSVVRSPTPVTVSGNAFAITLPASSVNHLVLLPSTGIRGKAGLSHGTARAAVWAVAGTRTLGYSLADQTVASISVVDPSGRKELFVPGLSGQGTLSLEHAGNASGLHIVFIKTADSELAQEVVLSR